MIKIKVLNNELSNFDICKSGFSLLIKYDNIKILFDTSIENEISENSKKFNENLNDVNYVILSHGHSDHCNGLINLNFDNAKLITHPLSIKKRFWNNIQVGPSWKFDEIKNKFNEIILTKELYKINDNIIFLGEIKINKYPIDKDIEYFINKKISKYEDDSALLIKTTKGLIVVTGCSHKDIRNIILYAQEITENKIYAVVGGFHLFDIKNAKETLNFFKEKNIKKIYPLHCLSKEVFDLFEKNGFKKLKSGDELLFN